MDYNYHTHTARCSHATGTDEEYVKRAIECGIRYMGFSDHIPHRYPDGTLSTYRIPLELCDDYFESIRSLREKYADAIDIKIGFEMEYYPDYFDKMLEYARNCEAEYLILGQHQIGNGYPDAIVSTHKTEDAELLRLYVHCVCEAIRSGVFTYIAHPDIINFVGDEGIYREEMTKLCELARDRGTPLEINFLGIRASRAYPRDSFWAIAGEVGAPVTFGFDAHDAKSAYDGESLKIAEAMVKKYGLNYIGKPTLVSLI